MLRGLSDTLEHLLPFTIASLAWWISVFSIVLAPGGTLALFEATDPRVISQLDRPSLAELARMARRHLRSGWKLALPVTVPVFVLLWNLRAYGVLSHGLGVLGPLWAVLLLTWLSLAACACSLVALVGRSPLPALREAGILIAATLPRALVAGIIVWLLLAIGGVLVVPIFMFLPAVVAAVTNRYVLDALGIAIVDPLAPTLERAREDAIQAERHRFGP